MASAHGSHDVNSMDMNANDDMQREDPVRLFQRPASGPLARPEHPQQQPSPQHGSQEQTSFRGTASWFPGHQSTRPSTPRSGQRSHRGTSHTESWHPVTQEHHTVRQGYRQGSSVFPLHSAGV